MEKFTTDELKSVKAIAMDFDGVFIEDSDEVFKKEAWEKVFEPYDGRHQPHFDEAKSLFGYGKRGGRKEIMEHVFSRLDKPSGEIDRLVKENSDIFDEHVQARIAEVGLIPGIKDFLKRLRELHIPIYLNSGTATPALRLSAKNLGIDEFIRESLGSTPEPHGGSKLDNLNYISAKEKAAPAQMLLIGDSLSDYRAAAEFKCKFLGKANRWNNWGRSEQPFPVIDDFRYFLKRFI